MGDDNAGKDAVFVGEYKLKNRKCVNFRHMKTRTLTLLNLLHPSFPSTMFSVFKNIPVGYMQAAVAMSTRAVT